MKMLSVYTMAVAVLLLVILPTVQGICSYTINSPDASAKHTVLGSSSFFSYSCTPCVRKFWEVHVLNMYQPSRTSGGTQPSLNSPQSVTVTIEAAGPTDIKLMLISHEAVHWVITKPVNVTIRHIVLVSYYKDSVMDLSGLSSLLLTHEDNYITGWESNEMADFVTNRFGFLSSYTGVYETSAWTLTVGQCEIEPKYLPSPKLDVIKKGTAAPKRKVVLPIPTEEAGSPKTGQHAILIVASVAIIISIGVAWSAAPKRGHTECTCKCRPEWSMLQHHFQCLVGNQDEEPGEIIEQPATPLLAIPSAPPLTLTERELEQESETPSPSAPLVEPESDPPPVIGIPPPAYQDAMNYPRPETPPPTYNSV